MIGIKEVNETRTMTRTKKNMTAYGKGIKPISRPLPLAKPGQIFTEAEKHQADKAWREKYHLN